MEPSAYLNDPAVLNMGTLARGAYSTLLLALWDLPEPGVVPGTDEALRALSRTTPEEWAQVRDSVGLAFDTESRPGFWVQKRMRATHEEQDRKLAKWSANPSASPSARGRLGGIAKARNRMLATATEAGSKSVPVLGSGSRFSVPVQEKQTDLAIVPLAVGASVTAQAVLGLKGTSRGAKREALAERDPLPPGELTSDEVFSAVFWPEYPRKVARRAAEAAWKRLRLRDTDEETMVAIMAGLRRDIRGDWKGREQDKIPHASTWINQRRWEG